MAAVALTLDVQERTKGSPHTGLWVGTVLVVEFLPTVVVGLLLGPLLDRLNRRALMIAADAIRVSVGTPEENEFFAVALGHVLSGVS